MQDVTPLDLDGWATSTAARAETPVLIRRLIAGRPLNLTKVDFPGFESTNSGGFDGQAKAEGSDPWVPDGASVWELSCTARASLPGKATDDFDKRTGKFSARFRKGRTFVFATPRLWPGKTAWADAKRALGQWKEVVAYDAEDLSAWLAQAPAAMAWISAKLGRSIDDVCAPEDLWAGWAGATVPPLPFGIFKEALAENRDRLTKFLMTPPTGAPLTVRADTPGEATAFAAGALLNQTVAPLAADRVLGVRSTAGLQQVRNASEPMVVIVQGRDVEAGLGDLASRAHVVIATDKATAPTEGAITIEPLSWEAFRATLGEMPLDPERAETLDRESGRRPTLMRRRLATAPAVREPTWSRDGADAQALVGLALIGAWHWSMPGDRAALAAVADSSEPEVEQAIQRLAALRDSPIYKVANIGGLVSRPDAFTALRGRVTASHLERFFAQARAVLGAPDPALDLPKDKRWAANVYGKTRDVSGLLFRNLAESVAFLAVSGADILGPEVAFDFARAADGLVGDLLAPDTAGGWMAVRTVLPALAEAAPEAFLAAIERDLGRETEDIGVWQLVKPVDPGFQEENLRTGLLWGLERLAWEPTRFPRVASVLAGLALRPLNDNWVNRPSGSLSQCLHPWLPQTAASAEARVKVLLSLDARHPDVAWQLALGIVDQRLSHGHYAARPDYRGDARGHGRNPVGRDPKFLAAATDILLTRTPKTLAQLTELVEKAPCFPAPSLQRLWKAIEVWAADASDEDRGAIREKLRQTAMRSHRRRNTSGNAGPNPRTQALYAALQPRDLAHRHKWLFRSWVEFGAQEIEAGDYNHDQREAHIKTQRAEALAELWSAQGLDGMVALAKAAEQSYVVGLLVAELLPACEPDEVIALLARPELEGWEGRAGFVGGVINGVVQDVRARLLERYCEIWSDKDELRLQLLLAAPLNAETWSLAERLGPDTHAAFWSRTTQIFHPSQGDGLERVCTELLKARRPTRALWQLQYNRPDGLPTALLEQVLRDVATVPAPPQDGFQSDPYPIQRIFEEIDKRSDADLPGLQGLEWIWINALTHSKRGLKALSAEAARAPDLIIQAVDGLYQRQVEGGEAPAAPDISPEVRARNAEHWYAVLERVSRAPASGEDGHIDAAVLSIWMAAAAAGAEGIGLRDRVDYHIGELLGRTAREVEGVWPSLAVALVLEPWITERLAHGVVLALFNRRGMHGRSKGAEERALAGRYRRWGERFIIDCPKLHQALESLAQSYDRDAAEEVRRARLERLAPA
jgi:hypothetical protein